jgi:hypothetical protein
MTDELCKNHFAKTCAAELHGHQTHRRAWRRPLISSMLDRFGKEAESCRGTGSRFGKPEVVEMVLVGQIRGEITTLINLDGGQVASASRDATET